LDFPHPNDEYWNADRPVACAEGPDGEYHPYHTNDFRTLQIIKSPYQKIEFFQNVERNFDTCFELDTGESTFKKYYFLNLFVMLLVLFCSFLYANSTIL